MRTPRFLLAAGALLATVATSSTARAQVTVQTINGSGQNFNSAFSSVGSTFTTGFKTTNDVTVTLLNGGVGTGWNDVYKSSPGNNPSFLTNYVGSAANGTGDGTAGTFTYMETSITTAPGTLTKLQYDFANGLAAGDTLLFSDLDFGEAFTVQAFTFDGSAYTPIDLTTGVTETNYSGQFTGNPTASWAAWNPTGGGATTGTFTGSALDLNRPVNALTFNQSVDRVVITKTAGNSGGTGIQFYSPSAFISANAPEPGSLALLLPVAGGMGIFPRKRRRGLKSNPS